VVQNTVKEGLAIGKLHCKNNCVTIMFKETILVIITQKSPSDKEDIVK
jgi:hypothetical protein